MPKTIISFEAKSIQKYILDSSKLKDMVGASELIENLCAEGGLLDEALAALSLQPKFSRRAGGSFTAFFDTQTDAENFQALWSYCIQQQTPGLVFAQSMETYNDDSEIENVLFERLPRCNEQARNQLFSQFPVPGPLVARAKRTGGAAVEYEHDKRLDEQTWHKRKFTATALERKIDPKELFKWPKHFPDDDDELAKETFPLLEDSYIGVIHADGNGLGSIVKNLGEKLNSQLLREALKDFSDAVNEATSQATRLAIRDVTSKHAVKSGTIMPARPLVVGGDDWSFIARGDLAIDFTATYLESFEAETEKAFKQLKTNYPTLNLPDKLTACAGIAFVKSKQPFYLAYNLAESLCKYAKKRAKPEDDKAQTPSALAFHRITTSQIDSYETIIERELTVGVKKDIVLTMQPYFIRRNFEPNIDDLFILANHLSDKRVSRGAVRELLDLLHEDLNFAQQRYESWKNNLRKIDQGLEKEIESILFNLTGQPRHKNLPGLLKKVTNKDNRNVVYYFPLNDALSFNSIRRGSEHDDHIQT